MTLGVLRTLDRLTFSSMRTMKDTKRSLMRTQAFVEIDVITKLTSKDLWRYASWLLSVATYPLRQVVIYRQNDTKKITPITCLDLI